MMEPLIAYLHYLSIILVGGFLVGELLLCRAGMTIEQAKRLAIIDAVFFASALAALATGLLRLFFYAKDVSFYTGNPVFWAKMALYVIIAALSITPTRTFLRWKRAATERGTAPAGDEITAARRLIHIELGLLTLMPLMAVLMARGIGR
jgi:putative membrane protein